MALSDEEIEFLAQHGYITPQTAEMMKAKNAGPAPVANINPVAATMAVGNPDVFANGGNLKSAAMANPAAAKAATFAQQMAAMQNPPSAPSAAGMQRPAPPSGLAVAMQPGTQIPQGPSPTRAQAPAPQPSGYIAPADVYGMQKEAKANGGVLPGSSMTGEDLANEILKKGGKKGELAEKEPEEKDEKKAKKGGG